MDKYKQIEKDIKSLNNKIYENSAILNMKKNELSNLNNKKVMYNKKINDIQKYNDKSKKIAILILLITLCIIGLISIYFNCSILPFYYIAISCLSAGSISEFYYKFNVNNIKKQIKKDGLKVDDNEINKCRTDIWEFKTNIKNFEKKKSNLINILDNSESKKSNNDIFRNIDNDFNVSNPKIYKYDKKR